MDATTRLIDLTVADLQYIIKTEIEKRVTEAVSNVSRMHPEPLPSTSEPVLYGMQGIAEALHCSVRHASDLLKQGVLEGGYQRLGEKKIIVKSAQALRDIAELNMAKQRRVKVRQHN